MKRKIENRIPVLLLILVIFIVLGEQKLILYQEEKSICNHFESSDQFRKMKLSEEMICYLQTKSENPGRDTGLYLLETHYLKKGILKDYSKLTFENLEKKWKRNDGYQIYVNTCIQVWNDVKCFPIPYAVNQSRATVSYTDSWLFERNYREKSVHEGTDLMANINERGYYPVVSMTDGIITNLGWLELGGYRVGITAPNGTYFYYAHLSSYADIEEGKKVRAGQLLGFMGDSGYGTEGTVGKFPVHLHVGIYLYRNHEEISLNPYWILRYSEKQKLSCEYD